jgi:hypothetical protein
MTDQLPAIIEQKPSFPVRNGRPLGPPSGGSP